MTDRSVTIIIGHNLDSIKGYRQKKMYPPECPEPLRKPAPKRAHVSPGESW